MRPPAVAFVSLGCVKNLVDSEKMLGLMAEHGCIVGADFDEADVIVVNTCGFLEASRQEAHEQIREAVAQKRRGRCRRVIVAGCLVQRDKQALLEAVPGIDALVGVNDRENLVQALGEFGNRRARSAGRARPDLFLGDYHPQSWSDTARLRLTPRHMAYLRISEGCNQKCTFCTIPSIRGAMRSKPLDGILAEARELIADGTVELNLIGQDTTSYGTDVGYQPGLAGLLRELNRLDGVRWLRLMYAYPSDFSDEMIDAIAACERVVKYIDMPLQHINDRMLRAMYRRVTRAQTETLLEKLRTRIPGVAIRTTLIAGFPGETQAEFAELVDFVRGFRFDALGVFAYSTEPGTPAARTKDMLPQAEREARRDALMAVQQDVAAQLGRSRVGTTFDALIEGGPDRDATQPARASFQAPDVDGLTSVTSSDPLPSGAIVPVRCTAADGYDLRARPCAVTLPVLSA